MVSQLNAGHYVADNNLISVGLVLWLTILISFILIVKYAFAFALVTLPQNPIELLAILEEMRPKADQEI